MKRKPPNSKDQGYVLLLLLLMLCFMAIAAAAIAPTIAFQIKRDREEEFIHRGAQYSRAVRRYAKSTGRYPLDLQDLNGKNGMRFIRRLYKDPITGKDFKLLYTRDIMAATADVPHNGEPVQGDVANNSSDANQNQPPADSSAVQQNNQNANSTAPNPGNQPASTQSRFPTGIGGVVQSGPSNGSNFGTIFGVASTSKEKTIREFEHKNHYNQWLFFYDINHETGQLITGPTRMNIPPPGQLTQPPAGAPSSSFGQPAGAQQTPPASPPAN